MPRPRKKESEKAKESFVVKLNSDQHNVLSNYASSLKMILSLAITKILAENKCFDYDIDDEMYLKILNFPENRLMNPRSISGTKLKIVRCWITKKEKKALAYCAIVKNNVSPSVFVNNLLKKFISSIKSDPEKCESNADVLIKDLWQHVSDKTKKELVEEYLKNNELPVSNIA